MGHARKLATVTIRRLEDAEIPAEVKRELAAAG